MEISRRRDLIRIVKFIIFSISAGIIQIATFTLLNEIIHWPYWPCYLIALTLSVLYNFTLNRRFTFQSAANIPIAMLKVFLYYCAFTPVSTWLGQIAANRGINEYVILLVTMVTNLLTEFLFCRFVVYRDALDTHEKAR